MFYYKKGDVICRIPWNKPSVKVFNKWLDEWRKIPGIDDYDLYLTGAFCQVYYLNKNIDTWDIDVFLISKSNTTINYPVLKNILEKSLITGYKNRLLIDICWAETFPGFKRNTWNTKKIRTYKEIIKKTNFEFSCNVSSNIRKTTEIIPGLYLFNIDYTAAYDKFLYKMKNSGYELPCKKLDI